MTLKAPCLAEFGVLSIRREKFVKDGGITDRKANI